MSRNSSFANEPFNIINGDFNQWENVWPVINNFFQIPVGIVRTTKLAQTMHTPDRAKLWKNMVKKYNLRDYYYDFLVNWNFADFVWHNGCDVVSSTSKLRQHRFFEFRDAEQMLLDVFGVMMTDGIIPSSREQP